MKKYLLLLFIICLIFTSSSYAQNDATPPTKQPDIQPTEVTALKREKPYYFAFKGGVYIPTDDLEDFDNGFSGEITLNTYFSEYISFEIGVGYFETEDKERGLLLKGVVPFKFGELFLGAGLSGYYVQGDIDFEIPGVISVSQSAHDYIVGAQFLGGLNYNITDTLFLGLEGKYIMTQDAELEFTIGSVPVELEFNLNGFIATGVLGFRF